LDSIDKDINEMKIVTKEFNKEKYYDNYLNENLIEN
jgi:hypothetical protein